MLADQESHEAVVSFSEAAMLQEVAERDRETIPSRPRSAGLRSSVILAAARRTTGCTGPLRRDPETGRAMLLRVLGTIGYALWIPAF